MTQPILAPEQLRVLSGFALSNVLLALDYDGTLAPIAPTPQRARMRPETRHLLTQVARLYPSVVISGRALSDVEKMLDGIPLWYLFGNHGLEPATAPPRHRAKVREWIRRLRPRLHKDLGVTIEDKTDTITLHYRHAPDRRRAITAIEKAVSELPNARAVGGAEAVNVLPVGGGDKGEALTRARRQFACDTAIYVGDDDTDEPAFGSDPSGRLLAIRVGESQASNAPFHLRSQEEMDAFLTMLLDLRTSRRRRERRAST